jgi:hypothetical protein
LAKGTWLDRTGDDAHRRAGWSTGASGEVLTAPVLLAGFTAHCSVVARLDHQLVGQTGHEPVRQLVGLRDPRRTDGKRGLRKTNRRVLTGERATYASWLSWFGRMARPTT